MSRERSRNNGVRKVCACPKQRWPKCPHSWYFNFKPPNGRAYRFSLDKHLGRHLETKAEALSEADRIRVAIREKRFQLGSPETSQSSDVMTVAQLVATYQTRHLNLHSKRSAPAEARRLSLAMRTAVVRGAGQGVPFGTIPVNDLTARDIDALIESRLGAKRKHCRCTSWEACQHPWRESGTNGRIAVNRLIARLRACFNWALRKQMIRSTPFRFESVATVSMLPETPRFRRLEGDEESRLLAACSPHLRAVVIAALETCCRVSELLSLQWSQVNLDRKELHIPARKTKAGRDRFLPVTNRLVAILQMRRCDPAGRELPFDAYVFGTPTGERIGSIKTAWRLTCARAGISGLHFHDLRREAGSRLMESGRFYLHDVQRFLDHADITTTSRYLQASRLALHSAVRLLDADRERSAITGAEANSTSPTPTAEGRDEKAPATVN